MLQELPSSYDIVFLCLKKQKVNKTVHMYVELKLQSPTENF